MLGVVVVAIEEEAAGFLVQGRLGVWADQETAQAEWQRVCSGYSAGLEQSARTT